MNAHTIPSPYAQNGQRLERRLSQRIFLYWLMACRDRPFAACSEIDPAVMGEDWGWCFIIDISRSEEFPFFTHLGERLARFSGVLLSGQNDWKMTVLDRATNKFRDAIDSRAPVLAEEEMALFDGRLLKFRSIFLPLSDDQRSVTHILGAANGKLEGEKSAA